MTKPACPRLFEAEALRDGRLAGAERLSFERHVGLCAHCSREMHALQALGDELRASAAANADVDELHVRRERTRLLAAFDATLVPPEQPRAARGWLVAAAATLLILSGLLLYFRSRVPPTDHAMSAVAVHADADTAWSRRSEGTVEKILLERGALSIQVDHAFRGRRLLVVLPDGELEDVGTRFTVSAQAGRTTRVSVQSGSVVLRIRGQVERTLGAGETWDPSVPAQQANVPVTESADAPPAPPSAAAVLPSTAARPSRAAAQTAALVSSAPNSTSSASPSRVDGEVGPAAATAASLDFRAAMAALDSGDNAAAAARFARFLATYPRDARGEDAAYLRVIALQRAGNPSGMKDAAAAYLNRYPNGFRRSEVAALAQ